MSYVSKTFITVSNSLASRDKRLSICLEADGFSFVEVSNAGVLQTYCCATGAHAHTMTGVMADVKQFLAEVGIRPLGYKRMELIVMSDCSTWVPDELYSSASHRAYLRLVGGHAEGVATCHSDALASTAVFSAPEHVVTAFKVAMPGVEVKHQHAKLAELATLAEGHPVVVAHFRQGRVDVAALSAGRYLMSNTFLASSADEVVFRLVDVMKSHQLEQPDAELLLCGAVDRPLYATCAPYFPVAGLYGGHATIQPSGPFDGFPLYQIALMLI